MKKKKKVILTLGDGITFMMYMNMTQYDLCALLNTMKHKKKCT